MASTYRDEYVAGPELDVIQLREQLAKANEWIEELEAHNELLMEVSWEMKEGKPDAFYKIKDARNTQASDALKKLILEKNIEAVTLFASSANETGQFGWSDCQWLTDYAEEWSEQLREEQENGRT